MNRNLYSVAVLTIILMMLIPVNAQYSSISGVSAGDSFAYKFHVYWSSTEPSAKVPEDWARMNDTQAIKITVHEALGSIVIMNITKRFLNGTEVSSQIWVNLLNGQGDGFGLLIAKNLSKNYVAYPMGFNVSRSFPIKEELDMRFPFGTRKVLHAVVNNTGIEDYRYFCHDMYFDQETGVMLRWLTEYVPRSRPNEKFSALWEITEFKVLTQGSNVTHGGSSNETTFNAMTMIMIAAALAVIAASLIITFKRIKRSKRKLSSA